MPVVTQPGAAVTVTPTSSTVASSTLSAGTIAGIVIGTLLGGVLFIVLVLCLLNRYSQRRFTRVVDPTYERVSASGGASDRPHLLRTSSRRANLFAHHPQKHSISTEPLISPVSWPPLPSISPVQSPGTPPRSNSISPGNRNNLYNHYDLGEISQVVASGTVSHSATPPIPKIPGQMFLWSGLGDTPPHDWQTSGDDAPNPPTPQKLPQTLFIRRMLQSRSRASEGVSFSHSPSLDSSTSRSTRQDLSGFRVDEEGSLAEAERTAVRDAEIAQRNEERITHDDDDCEEAETTESIYSQTSAPIDHSVFFSDPISRQNSASSVPHRRSSRKQFRMPALSELPSVVEVPDVPRILEGQSTSRRISLAGDSSPDGHVSDGIASLPTLPVIDQHATLPLLTSSNFGKDSTTSGTPPGSISSTTGWGSSSGGRASRYPSLAPSSSGQSSRSGPRSDVGTDWHHPPSGLAGLASLRISSLQSPDSLLKEQHEKRDASLTTYPAVPMPAKHAHLREGTVSSTPEVERRSVMQGGIAHIDVAL